MWGKNTIIVSNCSFVDLDSQKLSLHKKKLRINNKYGIVSVTVSTGNCRGFSFHNIILSNSTFANNILDGHLLSCYINTTHHALVNLDKCMFFNNIKAKHLGLTSNYFGNVTCIVRNVTFLQLRNIYVLSKVHLIFKG